MRVSRARKTAQISTQEPRAGMAQAMMGFRGARIGWMALAGALILALILAIAGPPPAQADRPPYFAIKGARIDVTSHINRFSSPPKRT